MPWVRWLLFHFRATIVQRKGKPGRQLAQGSKSPPESAQVQPYHAKKTTVNERYEALFGSDNSRVGEGLTTRIATRRSLQQTLPPFGEVWDSPNAYLRLRNQEFRSGR